MRMVVTGGSGFIGARLVQELHTRGHQVRVVDVRPLRVPAIALDCESVLDAEAMRRVIRDADSVIHLAGDVRDGFRREPYRAGMLQFQGTLNILEACRLNAIPHFLLASSFYVYQGLPGDMTVDEETPLDLLHMELFGAAKLISEALCREYTRKYGLAHTIFRLGSAYGAGGSNVVHTFIEAGLAGRPLEVWGTGQRRNQYTFVGDLVQGIIAGLASPNETFNLISPETTTSACLAELVGQACGVAVRFDHARREEPSLPCASSTKAIEQLRWCPTALREGLKQTEREIRNSPVVPDAVHRVDPGRRT